MANILAEKACEALASTRALFMTEQNKALFDQTRVWYTCPDYIYGFIVGESMPGWYNTLTKTFDTNIPRNVKEVYTLPDFAAGIAPSASVKLARPPSPMPQEDIRENKMTKLAAAAKGEDTDIEESAAKGEDTDSEESAAKGEDTDSEDPVALSADEDNYSGNESVSQLDFIVQLEYENTKNPHKIDFKEEDMDEYSAQRCIPRPQRRMYLTEAKHGGTSEYARICVFCSKTCTPLFVSTEGVKKRHRLHSFVQSKKMKDCMLDELQKYSEKLEAVAAEGEDADERACATMQKKVVKRINAIAKFEKVYWCEWETLADEVEIMKKHWPDLTKDLDIEEDIESIALPMQTACLGCFALAWGSDWLKHTLNRKTGIHKHAKIKNSTNEDITQWILDDLPDMYAADGALLHQSLLPELDDDDDYTDSGSDEDEDVQSEVKKIENEQQDSEDEVHDLESLKASMVEVLDYIDTGDCESALDLAEECLGIADTLFDAVEESTACTEGEELPVNRPTIGDDITHADVAHLRRHAQRWCEAYDSRQNYKKVMVKHKKKGRKVELIDEASYRTNDEIVDMILYIEDDLDFIGDTDCKLKDDLTQRLDELNAIEDHNEDEADKEKAEEKALYNRQRKQVLGMLEDEDVEIPQLQALKTGFTWYILNKCPLVSEFDKAKGESKGLFTKCRLRYAEMDEGDNVPDDAPTVDEEEDDEEEDDEEDSEGSGIDDIAEESEVEDTTKPRLMYYDNCKDFSAERLMSLIRKVLNRKMAKAAVEAAE